MAHIRNTKVFRRIWIGVLVAVLIAGGLVYYKKSMDEKRANEATAIINELYDGPFNVIDDETLTGPPFRPKR